MFHSKLRPTRLLRAFVLAALVVPVLGLGADHAPGTYQCVSRPSDVRDLGFSTRGKVADLLVKPGDAVKKGQLLVRLDDSVQKPAVEYSRLQAEDNSAISLGEASLAYREKELELVEQTRASQAGNDALVREARFRRDQARIELEQARNQQRVRQAEHARGLAELAQMQILSPLDGEVLDVRKHPGETVDEGTPALTVLSIDPLWLEVSIPTREAAGVRVGQSARVVFEDIDDKTPIPGIVIYKAAAGNAGAREVQVRVEVPNPNHIPSGMHGQVALLPAQNPGSKPAGPAKGGE